MRGRHWMLLLGVSLLVYRCTLPAVVLPGGHGVTRLACAAALTVAAVALIASIATFTRATTPPGGTP